MPNFAANLSMMFPDAPFLDRFARAAAAGFRAVEFLFPYEFPAEEIGARLKAEGLTQALFNLPPGDWAKGERGMACRAERFDEVMAGIERARPYIRATGVRRVHLMAGHGDRTDPGQAEAYRRAVAAAADALAPDGIDVVIEPINARNMPGYFLGDFGFAAKVVTELARPNLKLQFDIYHRQIMHGDVTTALREMMPIVGHIQIASVPDRHEPTGDELNWPFLFGELDRLGYAGFVGCEYNPARGAEPGGTEAGLAWLSAATR